MRKLLLLIIVICFGLFLINSCSGEKTPKTEVEKEQTAEKSLDVSVDLLTYPNDVVCGMDLTKHAIGDTAIYEGQLYGFCSDYCKTKFKEDPATILAEYEKGQAKEHEHE